MYIKYIVFFLYILLGIVSKIKGFRNNEKLKEELEKEYSASLKKQYSKTLLIGTISALFCFAASENEAAG